MYNFTSQQVDNKELSQVMLKLPKDLNDSMKKEINHKLLSNFPIFEKYFSTKTLSKLIHKIEEKVYLTNEVIYSPGQIDIEDQCLYLLVKGKVDIFDPAYFHSN